MKRMFFGIVFITLFHVCAFADAPGASEAPSTAPVSRMDISWWADRHREVLAEIKANPTTELLLIGDSITNNYVKSHPPDEDFWPTWQTFYGSRGALNLGFSGDTTSNVLWRLQHGEVDGIHPKVVLLLIGTNNTGVAHQNAQQTELGIDAVIGELESRLPDTKILLLGILPSDVSAEKTRIDEEVNRYLAVSYGDNPRVKYLDIGSIFKQNGKLRSERYYDPRLPQHGAPLHPDTIGQRWMAEAIEPTLAQLLGESPRVPLQSMTDVNTATIPVDWLEQDSYDWYGRHHQELHIVQERSPCVVMLGDSITHFWGGMPAATRVNGAGSWAKTAGNNDSTLNLGFGWDRTQNVLWRLRQGELNGASPEWVVLNIGTNNLTGTAHARANTPQETVAGIQAIIHEVHFKSPSSRIALMGIFPRGDNSSNLRNQITQTNTLLRAYSAQAPYITWIDINSSFLSKDGELRTDLLLDGTHPNEAGYRVWQQAMQAHGVECQ